MNTRRIILEQLSVQASIGILDHELAARQPLILNATFDTVISQTASDMDIDTVLDYRALRAALVEECTQRHINLLETLVDNILTRILQDFPSVQHVKIRVSKPLAFEDCAAVSIEQTRSR
ncbi:dihydroneopterin aldolase [Alcaligenaceae bacterium CGII-47]|nr:dihydroneopterin aldolase [Alcaligenaceae bacterium CGII-47]